MARHDQQQVVSSEPATGHGNGNDGKKGGTHVEVVEAHLFDPRIHNESYLGKIYSWVIGDEAFDTTFRGVTFETWMDFSRFFDPRLFPARLLFFVLAKTEHSTEFAGLWWANIEPPVAWGHFMFRRKFWATTAVVDGSRQVFTRLFNEGKVGTILGLIPEDNKRAINFGIKRFGFNRISEVIPGVCGDGVGGVVLYLTKEEFDGR